MKIQLKSDEDLTIVTKGGGNVIVPNNTDTSTDKTLATVDQIGPGGEDKANSASLAAPYETDHSSAYVVGDYVTHEGMLYKCKSDTSSPPGEWDDNKWDAVAVTDEIGGVGGITAVKKSNGVELTPDPNGAVTLPSHKVYAATGGYRSQAAYTATTTAGDFVLSDGAIVIMNCPISNTANPTLNVDGSGDKSVRGSRKYYDSDNVPAGAMQTGGIYAFQCYKKDSSWFWILMGNFYAQLASPAFTGTPTAPTAAAGTNTTQIATTEFVQREISNLPDSDRIVSENENTKVVANNDGTATIDKNVLTSKPIVHLTAGTFSGYNEIVLQNDVTADMNQAIHEYGSRYRLTIDGIDFYYIFDGNHPDLGRSFTVGLNYEFDITDWDNVNPTITLNSGSYTGVASVSRHAIDSKVIATVDQIVVVDVVDPTTDGSGTGKAADANSTGLALELTSTTFSNWKTVPATYNGYPITIELLSVSNKTWAPFANHNQIGIGYPDENQTSLNWSSDFASIPISASRSVIGYVLGEQTDKELAPASVIGDINSVLDAINGEEI